MSSRNSVRVQHVEYSARRLRLSRTPRDGFSENGLELGKVGKLAADVVQVCRRDGTHVATTRLAGLGQGQQVPDVLETKPQFARAPDEC